MEIQENVTLAPYTTFKIGGEAKYFCEIKDQLDALNAFEFAGDKNVPVFVLGGGSNVLFSDSGFYGLVARVVNKGIEVISENEEDVVLKVASGEVWDEVVKFAVNNQWWGIENLSHIPGSTGAIAVQNVGAYGQEAKNVIEQVTVFNKDTHQIASLNNTECGFEYRSSVFNASEKGKYIIFYITFKLSKKPTPILTYRDLKTKFETIAPSLSNIRQAVIEIRDKKYPFPTNAKNGNAGSFFKNVLLALEEFKALKSHIGAVFGTESAEILEKRVFAEPPKVKVPSAYLLELCGLKDVAVGGAKINHNQPLVVVNETGTATAEDVLSLAKKVISEVYAKIGAKLKIEPELVGFSPDEISNL